MGAIKTEHTGAKNGGGHWGTRAEAKALSKRKRRAVDKRDARVEGDGESVLTYEGAMSSYP